MRITTKSKYGLRAVYYLKQNKDKGPISLSTLVKDLHLSQNYLEQIFIRLKQAKIIDSKRGKYGGYYLAREADQITVGELIRVLEGNDDDYIDVCSDPHNCNSIDCITLKVFQKMDHAIHSVIDNMTLADF